jgi:hypothetical protein
MDGADVRIVQNDRELMADVFAGRPRELRGAVGVQAEFDGCVRTP